MVILIKKWRGRGQLGISIHLVLLLLALTLSQGPASARQDGTSKALTTTKTPALVTFSRAELVAQGRQEALHNEDGAAVGQVLLVPKLNKATYRFRMDDVETNPELNFASEFGEESQVLSMATDGKNPDHHVFVLWNAKRQGTLVFAYDWKKGRRAPLFSTRDAVFIPGGRKLLAALSLASSAPAYALLDCRRNELLVLTANGQPRTVLTATQEPDLARASHLSTRGRARKNDDGKLEWIDGYFLMAVDSDPALNNIYVRGQVRHQVLLVDEKGDLDFRVL